MPGPHVTIPSLKTGRTGEILQFLPRVTCSGEREKQHIPPKNPVSAGNSSTQQKTLRGYPGFNDRSQEGI